MTLNIWNVSGDWGARRHAILSVLRDTAPDIVCLQEVVANDRGNQAEWLAKEWGGDGDGGAGGEVHCAFGGTPLAVTNGRFGNAILSRWPIDHVSTTDLPYEPDDRDTQRVVVHARTGGVDVFSTHLAWQLHDAALRERQVRALTAFVAEQSDSSAAVGPVVSGDFNAEPDSTAIRYLCGLASLNGASTYFQDAWRLAGDGGPGLTWSRRNDHAAEDNEPDRRLDYIFSWFRGRSGAGRPLACRVVADTPIDGVWPSDHFGVLAVLSR
jgi:endonuclease/exonuclease/phosphatase family metal-dependent hydrolase